MPKLDGYQLTAAIRKAERRAQRPRTPVIAITANVSKGEPEHCMAMGMDGFLGKPVRIAQLSAALRRWLPHVEFPAGGQPEGKAAQPPQPADDALFTPESPVDTAVLRKSRVTTRSSRTICSTISSSPCARILPHWWRHWTPPTCRKPSGRRTGSRAPPHWSGRATCTRPPPPPRPRGARVAARRSTPPPIRCPWRSIFLPCGWNAEAGDNARAITVIMPAHAPAPPIPQDLPAGAAARRHDGLPERA